MSSLTTALDTTAIGIAVACTLHCLLLPVALVAAPSVTVLASMGESLHLWLLVLVVPVSLIALGFGCRKHRRWPILMLGLSGIFVSLASVTFGHDLLGESGEILGTVAGAALICASHVQNRLCCRHVQEVEPAVCSTHSS